jgi:ABC-type maltose transport system permease subunit
MSQVMAQQALPIAACSAVDEIALPLVVLFVMSSQQLISGLTTGVVK